MPTKSTTQADARKSNWLHETQRHGTTEGGLPVAPGHWRAYTDLVFTATLPHPPGINRTYKSGFNVATGKPTFYKSKEAKSWADAAWALCKAAGWPKLPRDTKLAVEFELFTTQSDIDCGIKACGDVVQHVLHVDDKNIIQLKGRKTIVPRDEQRLVLSVREVGE